MSNQIVLSADVRTDVGKGASRRLRRLANRVPGIVYGAGKDAVSVSLARNELDNAMGDESFFSQIIELRIGDTSDQVVVRDLQRHPAEARVLHIDFMRVSADQAIVLTIPIHFENEDRCVGVRMEGGVISHTLSEVEVSCLPGNLPEYIAIDMTDVHVGTTIHLLDLQMPEGVTLAALAQGELDDEHNTAVVSVATPRGGPADEEEGVEGGEQPALDSGDQADDGDD